MKKVLFSYALFVFAMVSFGIYVGTRFTDNTPNFSSLRPSEGFVAPTAPKNTDVLNYKDIDLSKGYQVFLTTEVNSVSSADVMKGIREGNRQGKPVYLLINSPGGSVVDGAHIISTIQSSKVPVYTVCLEICASMAAMILEYGTERYAVDRSIIMFHPASVESSVSGDLDKVVSRFQFLKRFIDKMDHFVATRAGQDYDTFKLKSDREYWVDAADAFNYNLVDAVVALKDFKGTDLDNFGNNRVREDLNLKWNF